MFVFKLNFSENKLRFYCCFRLYYPVTVLQSHYLFLYIFFKIKYSHRKRGECWNRSVMMVESLFETKVKTRKGLKRVSLLLIMYNISLYIVTSRKVICMVRNKRENKLKLLIKSTHYFMLLWTSRWQIRYGWFLTLSIL